VISQQSEKITLMRNLHGKCTQSKERIFAQVPQETSRRLKRIGWESRG
jgi:hypothetical protein